MEKFLREYNTLLHRIYYLRLAYWYNSEMADDSGAIDLSLDYHDWVVEWYDEMSRDNRSYDDMAKEVWSVFHEYCKRFNAK